MDTQFQSPPWGYLVRLDEAALIIELRGRFVPISFNEELAFKIDHNEIAETTLWVASFPCWVSTWKVKGKRMKIKYNSMITVKMGKKFQVLFVKRSIDEVFLHDAKICGNYIVGKLLGQGGFGQVFSIYKKTSGEKQALKVQHWTESGARYLAREADILLQLKHPCIIKTYDIKYSKTHMYIIMEYMYGGDLSRFVNLNGCHLSMQETKLIFYQIVKAVNYLHSKGVCHRDLKPANILLCQPKPRTLIKVTDLGLAKSEIMHGPMYSCCGTKAFLAPEVLEGGRIYDKKVDVWSMGVILYLSLSGTLPMFSGDTLQFTGVASLSTNTPVMQLLQGMLCKQPLIRFDIGMVGQHPWLQDKTVEKKVQCLMSYFGNDNVNIKNQPTKVLTSKNDKRLISATTIMDKGNNNSKLKTVVKTKSHQIAEKKNAAGPEKVQNYQNVNPITTKISVSTNESKNKNFTLKADVSNKSNTTLDILTRSLVERKPEVKQQYTNIGHNYKTINDRIISMEISYSANHGLKPQSYSYEHSRYNLDSSYKKAFISKYANSNQDTTLKAEVPNKINPSDVPTMLYVGKKTEDIFRPIDEDLNCDIYYYRHHSYNTISGYKKNLVPTYETKISNSMSPVSKATVSHPSTMQYVKRRPTVKENNWISNAYHNIQKKYGNSHGNNYIIEDFHYQYDNNNDFSSIKHNNLNHKDNSEGGLLSSVFQCVCCLEMWCFIGYGIFLYFSSKK
ncbi:hypothetical protein R5R35_000521 [Gryllus longicercus]|uniref:Protein kinase domain-containing protein n=1 Tax=Gryllus longicercus TaxID=2509291 RepID=A0AAN9ZAT3_9ORTH